MSDPSPYDWPGRPGFGLRGGGAGHAPGHAVVISWHLAPDFGTVPGQDRCLGIWAEPLLDALVEAGARTTLLMAYCGAPAMPPAESPLAAKLAPRGVALRLVAAADATALARAVDQALAALSPDIVHAPERQGVLAAALARRAAGLAHLDTVMVLHGRGPLLFRMEEQARFIATPEALVVDELERRAMALADDLVTSSEEVAAYLASRADMRAARLVAPLVWPLRPGGAAPIRELVFPLPFASESGLEFAVATLVRAAAMASTAARQPLPRAFPLAITFLGQPDSVTIGSAAQALAGLAPAGPRLDWQVKLAETPQRAIAYLAQPGRMALFTAARATPPEWLAICAGAGIPAIATANRVTLAAAGRDGGLQVVPRAERGFAAALARLPEIPAGTPPRLGAETPPPPHFHPLGWRAAPALAWLAEESTPALTVICEPRAGLLASLAAQELPSFATTVLLPGDEPVPPPPPRRAERPLRLFPGGLAAALADCPTRYAVLCGAARALHPKALAALLRAARATGMSAVTAADGSHGAKPPLGGGMDLALLLPGRSIGHLVLLDLAQLRGRGGRSLALAGTPGFAAALAEESQGVLALPDILTKASMPPPPAAPPPPGRLPPGLRGVAGMAAYYARRDAVPAAGPGADAMATANRQSTHYLKLLGRALDAAGLEEAAADAWEALLARDAEDGETWTRHGQHALRRHGMIAGIDALAGFVRRHGVGPLGPLVEAAVAMAGTSGGLDWLRPLAPALLEDARFAAALAGFYARLPAAQRLPAALPRGLSPTATAALRDALAEYGLELEDAP